MTKIFQELEKNALNLPLTQQVVTVELYNFRPNKLTRPNKKIKKPEDSNVSQLVLGLYSAVLFMTFSIEKK